MNENTLSARIAAARGDLQPDLVLKNTRLVNTLTGEIDAVDIVIHEGYVVALDATQSYSGTQTIDLEGRFVAPGFIDAHVHIESSLCTPGEFAKTVSAGGVTTVITDPHEIANVLGLEGIRFMLVRGEASPINVFVNAPSCVPATHMETSGATLTADDLASLLDDPHVIGLAEMMNYPGVIWNDAEVIAKLERFAGRPIDGHAPSVTGKQLQAYVASGIGSDHECTTVAEAQEKLRLGMTLFIREGTATRNLKPLLPVVTERNHQQICFCTDDRQPNSLLDAGSIDYMVRVAIAEGIDPILAIRMATINTARYFRLHELGAIAPGRRADLIVFSDMQNLRAEQVYKDGQLIAENGKSIVEIHTVNEDAIRPTMNVDLASLDVAIPAHQGGAVHVIGVIPDQIVTDHFMDEAELVDGFAVSDPARDLLKMVVIERHHASGKVGKGFIRGFGLKRGAIAGSVAHDHHNLVVVGVDDHSIRHAAEVVTKLGGGLAVVEGDQVLGTLPLEIAGLMTDAPMQQVREQYDVLIQHAQDLGSPLFDPFMTMSFMALEVIPKLKLTDIGLVDVEKFALIPLFAE